MREGNYYIEYYINDRSRSPFVRWFNSLDLSIQIRLDKRINRVRLGVLGDHKYIGEDIYEFRFFFGAGYRIYFSLINQKTILLLYGGDKNTQKQDVRKAKLYFLKYLEVQNEKRKKK